MKLLSIVICLIILMTFISGCAGPRTNNYSDIEQNLSFKASIDNPGFNTDLISKKRKLYIDAPENKVSGINLKRIIKEKMEENGYVITDNRNTAPYILTVANIYISPSLSNFAEPGFTIGKLAGAAMLPNRGDVITGAASLAGGVAVALIGSAIRVEDPFYITADVEFAEISNNKKSPLLSITAFNQTSIKYNTQVKLEGKTSYYDKDVFYIISDKLMSTVANIFK